MSDKADVWQGTLALMILKTLETLGPLRGYGIARRIEQISGDVLSLNYGTVYPALLKLEQEGSIESEWGVSDNKSQSEILQADACWAKTARTRSAGLATSAGDWNSGIETRTRPLIPFSQVVDLKHRETIGVSIREG